MANAPDQAIDQQAAIDDVLADYLQRVDEGEAIDRDAFIAGHADVADALKSYFAGADEIDRVAGPAVGETVTGTAGDNVTAVSQESQPTLIAADGAIPREFGRYRVQRTLGSGAMGAVYLAEDTQLDRQVAIKVPRFAKKERSELLMRFNREAKAAATLSHPNVCPVYDVGEIDGTHFISMGYIEGRPLNELIDPARPLSETQVATIIRKLALAMAEAHQHGIVHRDIKPANIMIDKRREPIIMDFGLARSLAATDEERVTHDGTIVGTPAYMPPEQIKGEIDQIGPAADIYSLGVVMYEMLTGRIPFAGSVTEVIARVLHDPPPSPAELRPDIDSRLDAICQKAMSKAIADRYASMSDFAAELAKYLHKPYNKPPITASSTEPTGKTSMASTPSQAAGNPSQKPSAGAFDPYHKWLGIPQKEQPPNHYRLLAIELFESDADAIQAASIARSTYVRQCASGPHAAVSQDVLNHLSEAEICLLNAEKKAAYDAQLKVELAAKDAAKPQAVGTATDTVSNSKKVKPAADSKLQQQIQKLDKQKKQIESLLDKCEFATAIAALEKMAAVKSPKLGKYAKWAQQQIPKAKRGTKEMRESSAAVYRTAASLFERNDYEEAAEMLQQIPTKYRDAEFKGLLQECIDLQEEIVVLQEDIDHAESLNKYQDLQPTVERLLELKPADRRAKRLLKELKTYGKGGGMRLGDRGDKRFDVAGNTSNPLKVALGILIPVVLFGAVGYAAVVYVRSNNKTIKIEIDDPSAKVVIDGETVKITGIGDEITLKVGMHDLLVERDGLTVRTDQFEVVKGKNPVLRISLEEAETVAANSPTPPVAQATNLGPPGLVSYYPLDETQGTTVKDASGNGHDGVVKGQPKRIKGKHGNAIETVNKSYIDLGKTADFEWSDSFSIGAWVQKPQNGHMAIVIRSTLAPEYRGYDLMLFEGMPLVHLIEQHPNRVIRVNGRKPITDSDWHHVMMTYDGSGKAAGVKIYLDGALQELKVTVDGLKKNSIKSDAPLAIGHINSGSELREGAVDDVQIYNRVLSAAEVQKSMSPLTGGQTVPSALAVAPFDSATARRHQQEWAKRLGVPIEKDVDLGNGVKLKMVLIPAGEFLMGSTDAEQLRVLKSAANAQTPAAANTREQPQHRVRITKPFYLAAHPVTQEQYEQFSGANPSHFSKTGAGKAAVAGETTSGHPVENVSWYDAVSFCNKLSERDQLQPCYTGSGDKISLVKGTGYRLPTEAEWEFACRAGSAGSFFFDNESDLGNFAWYDKNSGGKTHTVGQKPENGFGLYDMHGNVWEWCWDRFATQFYETHNSGEVLDPIGPTVGSRRVVRGGFWGASANSCRAAFRDYSTPNSRKNHMGFRLAAEVQQALSPDDSTGIFLTDLKPTATEVEFHFRGTAKAPVKVKGIDSTHGFHMHPKRDGRSGRSGVGKVSYALNRKYQRLSGTFGILDYLEVAQSAAPIICKIQGDGKVLYTSPPLQKRGSSIDFNVDVAQINILQITSETQSTNHAHIACVEPLLHLAGGSSGPVGSASASPDVSKLPVICQLLQSKRAPQRLIPAAVKFDAPRGGGRSGANGFLLDAPAGWDSKGTVWSCDFARDGASRGIFFIHPHKEGQLIAAVSPGGLHLGSPSEWPNDGNSYLYIPRYQGFKVTATPDFKQLMQLGDQSHQLTSKLDSSGKYELFVDGKLVATAQVTTPPLLKFKAEIQVAKQPVKGTGGAIIGPTDQGSARASNLRFGTIGSPSTGPATSNTKLDPAVERKAANWVISVGGAVAIQAGGKPKAVVAKAADLPQTPFQVVEINLEKTKITDEDLSNLQGLSGVTSLRLVHTPITGVGLKYLADQTSITTIGIEYSGFTDEGMAELAKLKGLQRLGGNHSQISDAGIAHLKGHPELTYVSLYITRVTDGCLSTLKTLPKLTHLILDGRPITDAGMVHMAEMPNLEVLRMGAAPISDVGIMHLKALPKLNYLNPGGAKVTEAGLEKLQAARAANGLEKIKTISRQ